MAEGGWDVPIQDSDFLGINTVEPEEQPRLHTERLVSSRSRDSERKISFPERGFRQQQPPPPSGLQLFRGAAAVAIDPFGEIEEDDERKEEWMLDVVEEELVQARNPHPVAPVAGFADRQQLDNTVWKQNAMQTIYLSFVFVITNASEPDTTGCHSVPDRFIVLFRPQFKCRRVVNQNSRASFHGLDSMTEFSNPIFQPSFINPFFFFFVLCFNFFCC